MWHIRGIREMHIGFWWENLNKRHHLENLSINVWIILTLILKKQNRRVWMGFIWLNTRTSGRIL
jgi:hypothetical protein